MNGRRPAAEQPTIESGMPRFPADEPGWAFMAIWIRKGKQVNVARKVFISGDLITRGNVVIFSFSDWEGNPRGDSAVSIVGDAGGNVSVEPRGASDSEVLDAPTELWELVKLWDGYICAVQARRIVPLH